MINNSKHLGKDRTNEGIRNKRKGKRKREGVPSLSEPPRFLVSEFLVEKQKDMSGLAWFTSEKLLRLNRKQSVKFDCFIS